MHRRLEQTRDKVADSKVIPAAIVGFVAGAGLAGYFGAHLGAASSRENCIDSFSVKPDHTYSLTAEQVVQINGIISAVGKSRLRINTPEKELENTGLKAILDDISDGKTKRTLTVTLPTDATHPNSTYHTNILDAAGLGTFVQSRTPDGITTVVLQSSGNLQKPVEPNEAVSVTTGEFVCSS